MRRREVLILGASLVGTAGVRRALGQDPGPSPRAAVVIGIDRPGKPGHLPPLTAAASGAKTFGDWLESQGFDVARFMDDKGPIAISSIKQAVSDFASRPNLDQLVIYFSGHGCLVNGQERWLLSGAPEDSGEAINFAASFDRAQRWPIANIVFISDACRSRPGSFTQDLLDGTSIFVVPDEAAVGKAPKIDKFFATGIGQPSLEVPIGENVDKFEGLYTSVFLDAFKTPDADMVVEVEPGVKVVPNRKLEDFLRREVRKRSAILQIDVRQDPQTDVCSSDKTYIGRLGANTKIAPAQPPKPNLSDVVNMTLGEVNLGLGVQRLGNNDRTVESINAAAAETGFSRAREVILSVQTTPEEVNLPGGFVVVGSAVERVTASQGVRASVAAPGERSIVQVEFNGPAATVAIRFRGGGGTVAVALRDFVGQIVVEDGLVMNVSYDQRGNPPSDQIRQLRATVATAAQFGSFRIPGYGEEKTTQAKNLGNTLRMGKFADPTLGLYAAYAYWEAALADGIKSIAHLMREELRVGLFDVSMLSGELSGHEPPPDVFPPCPMLSQGWNLLRVRDVTLPPAFEQSQRYLLPALWTTFAAPGMDLIEQAMKEGGNRKG
ncbi:caspase family protein (plasmid) [Rhizobium ruizarguesonis]|nr:caspase family protein [Rhizobium ruizarguesonis]